MTWTKASRWCTRYALASAWESALLLPHGRGWARSLDDGILVKQRGDYGSVTPGLPGHDWALPLCQGISGIGCDTVSEGVPLLMGILQLVGQPQVRQGVRPRAGAPAGFPNLLTSPPWSNPANRPGPQTMPECRFNKYNATSKKQSKFCGHRRAATARPQALLLRHSKIAAVVRGRGHRNLALHYQTAYEFQ